MTPVEGFAVYDSGDADYPFTVAGLTGDFKVEGGEPGTDYSYEYKSSTLKILTGKSMTVSMRDGVAQTERDRIVVPVNTNADVALAGVDVRLSGDDDCAFQIELGAGCGRQLPRQRREPRRLGGVGWGVRGHRRQRLSYGEVL